MPGFEEIVGHEQIVTHLKSAMKLGKVSHAYILSGEKGCGKKLLADVFAETLQCEKGGTEPCGSCHSCVQAQSGNHPDIIHLMHEKPNSISVDDVRTQIVNDVLIKPYSGKYKIYIVPDAEKMTAAAQNALLKTIEEPPAYAVILLLANNASALLPTILSRCVMLSLKPVADDKVKQYLMEHVQVPDYEADVCVAFAQGNIGKAVQLATSDSFNEIKNSALHLLKNVSIGITLAAWPWMNSPFIAGIVTPQLCTPLIQRKSFGLIVVDFLMYSSWFSNNPFCSFRLEDVLLVSVAFESWKYSTVLVNVLPSFR